MAKRKRFQHGHLKLRKGATAKWWDLYYRDADGRLSYKVLGTTQELPSKAEAKEAAAKFLAPLNSGRISTGPVTLGELAERFELEEMPERYSTRNSYKSLLKCWIVPRWKDVRLADFDAVEVEAWLESIPKATKTKSNIRQLLHVMFECARRWKLMEANPIQLVRQSAARSRQLAKISIEQYRQILGKLIEPYSTMVLLAGCCGLRVGEIIGLQWGDLDFDRGLLHVRRDVYQGRVDEVKTASAERVMPLHATIVQSLMAWRLNAQYQADEEFVFSQDNGRPMWADTVRESVLYPVSENLGLGKVGWHAFRHLFASTLPVVGANTVVAKELMGHSDYRTTESYMYGFEDQKRQAAENVAKLLNGVLQ